MSSHESDKAHIYVYSPLAASFFVLIIFAANSRPVDFCTHLRTMENAPLKRENKSDINKNI